MNPTTVPSSEVRPMTGANEGSVVSLVRRLALAGGAGLSAGIAAYVVLVRPPSSYDMLATMAIGAAFLASALVLWRSFFPVSAEPVPSPAPMVEPPPVPRPRVESAFVCAKCGEYSAAPDWDAMLRALDAPTDLEGRGEEKPAITPAPAPVDPIWPRWHPSTAAAAAPQPPGATSPSAYVPASWGNVGSGPEREPEQIYSEAEMSPVPVVVGESVPSGSPWFDPADPDSRFSLPHPLLGPEPGPEAAGPSRSGGFRIAAPFPDGTLERWISEEADGLLSHPGPVAIPPEPAVAPPSNSAWLPPIEVPDFRPCATCESPVDRTRNSERCTRCRRPICENCRGSVVRHHEESYCVPCDAQQRGADLLRTLEDPIPIPLEGDPLDEDLGVPLAHPGGRRPSGRAGRPTARSGRSSGRERATAGARTR